ncbi:MAG TPA: tryptophan--tRNA ligase [Candidatus Elarobacter sp.]|jgi:tryptophanyl-tRNA synthetase
MTTPSSAQSKPVVFSGIQPTGTIHIGNYFGAVRRWAAEQDQFFNIFCLVDLHAITVPQDPAVLREKIVETGAILLAAGIDPQRSALFVQSDLPEHAELAWLLNCIASMGQLNRMTQYKEKSGDRREHVTVGLFTYPLLMAADILLYRTNYVPVGSDQKQHVELTRDLAQRFNATYGETFVLPEPRIPAVGARIMGLDDPTKKMSKSATGGGHAVGVLDPPDLIKKTVMSAQTDSGTEIRIDPERPGVTNLLSIYMAATGASREDAEAHFAGKGYGALKREIVDALTAELEPLQRRYAELRADPDHVRALLRESARAIQPLARRTLDAAKRAIGVGH